MKHYQKKYFQMVSRIAGLVFAVSLVFPSLTAANPLDLATIPLANSPTVAIQPNLLFVLDDSGSMAWNFMPDQLGYDNNSQDQKKCRKYVKEGSSTTKVTQCSGGTQNGMGDGGDPPIYSTKINTVYYNPSVRYEPPVNPCNLSGRLPSQTDWTAVRDDGLKIDNSCSQTSTTKNIVTQYPERVYCDVHGSTTLTAISKTSGTGQYMCKQNGIDQIAGVAGDYDYPQTTGNWYATGSGFGTYIKARDYNSNPHYYNVIPREHCTDNTLVNCTLSTTPTGSYTVPAYVRYCKTDALASSALAVDGTSSGTNNCQAAFNRTSYSYARYGTFQRVDIKPLTTYPKAGSRTDCIGATCTYDEEMTNFANWYAYYRTRMQMMKSASSLAFKDVGEDFRVAFMTIKPVSTEVLNFHTFDTATKTAWYKKLYSIVGGSGTPLREALAIAGRIYADKATIGTLTDPVEYACQKNFTLLTTDGFWNGNEGVDLDGSPIADMDGTGTLKPKYEGSSVSLGSLADVAKYYRDTDLRTSALSNCGGALGLPGDGVCQDPPPSTANQKQSMVTFTLGLGVDGTLTYIADYDSGKPGDFLDITNGTKNWPVPVADTPTAIDDLWHAAVNGEGIYFSAKDPIEVASSLRQALAEIQVKIGAGAAAATSTLNPVTGDSSAYVASYMTGQWTGNLERRNIDVTTGAVQEAAVKCVEDVVPSSSCALPAVIGGDGAGNYYCVTSDVADPADCAGSNQIYDVGALQCKVSIGTTCTGVLKGQATRNIKMNGGGALVDFTYANIVGNINSTRRQTFETAFLQNYLSQWNSLSPDQKLNVTGNNLVNYLRGSAEFEEKSSDFNKKVFRNRQALLGDVIDSKPAFLGAPTFSYTDPGYDSFKATQTLSRATKKTVFVGSNDGMLHAFDADTLEERWAYVPTMVIPNMWKLADRAYDLKHSYYADGEPVISDICVSGCSGTGATWKTILVAGLNGGGRGYYALDITDPTNPSLLWEFDADDETNLGYTFGSPVVTKRPSDGKWVVLVTSGYNNIPDDDAFYDLPSTKFKPNNPALYTTGNGQSYLYVLDAVTGSELTQIATGVSAVIPSGLGKIKAFADDAERNNTATFVYGGDLLGNLWRFDLATNSVLKFATLEANGFVQPITTAPELGVVNNKKVIFVGTGKYLEKSDLTNTNQQTLYAIKDDNAATTMTNPRGTAGMVPQTIAASGANQRVSSSNNVVDFSVGSGWFIDLPDARERQNVNSQLVLGTLLVPTTVPISSVCQPAGYGWFNYFDYKTGLSVTTTPASGIVSQRTGSPAVGFNVVYVDGKPKVSVVTADNPTPQLLPDIPFSGSGTGFQSKRTIWRELIN